MKSIIFSTGNDEKFMAGDKICAQYGITLTQQDVQAEEIQSEDGEYVAKQKARAAYKIINKPVLITDDSWQIPGLNGFPGPYMRPVNEWLTADDFIRLTIPLKDRRVFQIKYTVYFDGQTIKVFHSIHEGELLKEARGKSSAISHTIMTMEGDNGLSIAEVFMKNKNIEDRLVYKSWHDFARWFTKTNNL